MFLDKLEFEMIESITTDVPAEESMDIVRTSANIAHKVIALINLHGHMERRIKNRGAGQGDVVDLLTRLRDALPGERRNEIIALMDDGLIEQVNNVGCNFATTMPTLAALYNQFNHLESIGTIKL